MILDNCLILFKGALQQKNCIWLFFKLFLSSSAEFETWFEMHWYDRGKKYVISYITIVGIHVTILNGAYYACVVPTHRVQSSILLICVPTILLLNTIGVRATARYEKGIGASNTTIINRILSHGSREDLAYKIVIVFKCHKRTSDWSVDRKMYPIKINSILVTWSAPTQDPSSPPQH